MRSLIGIVGSRKVDTHKILLVMKTYMAMMAKHLRVYVFVSSVLLSDKQVRRRRRGALHHRTKHAQIRS